MEGINYDSYDWPDGRETVGEVRLERDLRRRLKRYGVALLRDRTENRFKGYQGGYMIVDKSKILAGTNFDMTLPDVLAWIKSRGWDAGGK